MTTLKGIFPEIKPIGRKNFIRENVQNLRKMEHYFQRNKEVDRICKCKKPGDKFVNVPPRVNTCLNLKTVKKDDIPRKTSAPVFSKRMCEAQKVSNKEQKSNKRVESRKTALNSGENLENRLCKTTSELNLKSNDKKKRSEREYCQISCKSQSIQTLSESDLDNLYTNGIIRYPSMKILDDKDEPKTRSEQELFCEIKKTPNEKVQDNENDNKVQKSFSSMAMNKPRQTVANKIAEQLSYGKTPKHRLGVVPKYLKQRKEALLKEQKEKEELNAISCPEGFILLPDDDRKETLSLLKKSYQDNVSDLNKLPIRNDTLRAQKKKTEIEKQLNKLEEGIKIFSRSKVYVALDS